MVNLEERDKQFLRDNFENAEELINAEHINDILDPLYDLIEEKGFAPPHFYDYNDFGREAQRVYDRIYYNG